MTVFSTLYSHEQCMLGRPERAIPATRVCRGWSRPRNHLASLTGKDESIGAVLCAFMRASTALQGYYVRALQTGYSRAYIEKLVAAEQAAASKRSGGVEYEYNTAVGCPRPAAFRCMLVALLESCLMREWPGRAVLKEA